MYSYSDLKAKFWSNVKQLFDMSSEDCWEWVGGKDKDGYGLMMDGSRAGVAKRKQRRATHVAYFLYKTGWPTKMLLHTCDCPSCVNPSHLYEGTADDNNKDMISKGRDLTVGQKNGNSKLTEQQVIKIKGLLKQGVYQRTIASLFKVNQRTISTIKCGQNWTHITI